MLDCSLASSYLSWDGLFFLNYSAFQVGAMAHGKIEVDYIDDFIAGKRITLFDGFSRNSLCLHCVFISSTYL